MVLFEYGEASAVGPALRAGVILIYAYPCQYNGWRTAKRCTLCHRDQIRDQFALYKHATDSGNRL
jgi:hypothetical protein